MTALKLEALVEGLRVDAWLEPLRKLRDGEVYEEHGRFMLTDGRTES